MSYDGWPLWLVVSLHLLYLVHTIADRTKQNNRSIYVSLSRNFELWTFHNIPSATYNTNDSRVHSVVVCPAGLLVSISAQVCHQGCGVVCCCESVDLGSVSASILQILVWYGQVGEHMARFAALRPPWNPLLSIRGTLVQTELYTTAILSTCVVWSMTETFRTSTHLNSARV